MVRNDNNEKITTLKPREELELLKTAKFSSGRQKEAALMSLIYYNQNLVKYIVKGYSYLQGQVDHEDLIAEGTIALAKAIDKFDVTSKNRFATYAGYWIRQYIQSFIHRDQLVSQLAEQKKSGENNEGSTQKTDSKFIRERFNVLYYDREYQNSDKDNKSYSLVDILSEKNDNVGEQIHHSDVKIHINEMLSTLEAVENLTIRLYYGIVPLTFKQLFQVVDENEKEELTKMSKSKVSWKRNWEQLRIDQKEVSGNRIVKKYTALIGKTYKTKEISTLINKAESVVRKLKQRALRKMKAICQKKGFDRLL